VLNILQKHVVLHGFDFFKMEFEHDKAKKKTPAETLALSKRKRKIQIKRYLESKLTYADR
jgi:hypothetical protein